MKHTLWAGDRRLAGADGGRTHSKQAPARTRGEKQPIRLPAADTRTLLVASSGQTTALCCSTRLCALRFATARPCSLSRSQPTGRRDARRCTCRGVYTGVRLCGWAMERSTLGAGACVIESAASERTIAAAARSNDAGLAVRGAWQPCMARTNSTVARQRRPRLPLSRLRPVLVSLCVSPSLSPDGQPHLRDPGTCAPQLLSCRGAPIIVPSRTHGWGEGSTTRDPLLFRCSRAGDEIRATFMRSRAV